MIKFYNILAIAVSMFLSVISCGDRFDDDMLDASLEKLSFTASIDTNVTEDDINTRTILSENDVLWNESDKVSVSNGTSSAEFNISSLSTDKKTAVFSGSLAPAAQYYAISPLASAKKWESNGMASVVLPTSQVATAGSFGNGASLSASAFNDGGSAQFLNCNAILAIQFKGSKDAKVVCGSSKGKTVGQLASVTLISNDNQPLSGVSNLTIEGGKTPTIVPAALAQGGSNHVELKGQFTYGAAYYFAVYPGNYTKGFKLLFRNDKGEYAILTNKTALNLKRNGHVLLANLPLADVLKGKWQSVAPEWRLVKSSADLNDGDVVRIGCADRGAVATALASEALTAKPKSATFNNGVMTCSAALDFTVGAVATDTYTLKTDAGYLTPVNKTGISLGVDSKNLTITFDAKGNADISASSSRGLLHSTASGGVIKNYADSNKPSSSPSTSDYEFIQLYKFVDPLSEILKGGNSGGEGGEGGGEVTPPVDPDPTPDVVVWKLVKDDSTLKAGDVIKIGSSAKKVGAGALNSSALSAVTATFSGDDMTCDAATEFTLGGSVNKWTLTSGNNELSAEKSGTKMSYASGTTWKITIQTTGDAEISAGSARCILVNNTGYFKHYATSNIGNGSYYTVQIYRKTIVSGGEGGGEVTPPVDPDPTPDPNPDPDPTPEPDPQPTPGDGKPAFADYTGWLELPGKQMVADQGMYCVSHHAAMEGKQQRNYSILYDSGNYTSLWVAYPLCQTHMIDNGGRKENWNQVDPGIPKEKQQEVNVTYQTGYDRGHQLPDASRKGCAEMQEQTYYPTNMTPQDGSFNRGIWKSLEDAVRKSVPTTTGPSDTVYVATGAAFQSTPGGNEPVTIIKHKTTNADLPVPNYYWKVVLKVKRDAKGNITDAKTAAFWFPVAEAIGNKFPQFETTVDDIETKTGFDFFVNLPDAIENRIEKEKGWASFQNF